MTLPYLDSKTHLPICSPNLVPRPRLNEVLNRCFQPGVQVGLVSAPAGFGKTTFLVQWIKTIPDHFHVGWLSLDEADNQLARFFSYLMASIQNVIPAISKNFNVLAEVISTPTVEQCVSFLCDQVVDCEENLILVIDDFHVITSPEIHSAIKNLIDHLPKNMRLIIAGRVEPAIPLARYRARGQLVDLHTLDLRFRDEEFSQFLSQFPELSEALDRTGLTSQVNVKTEGWAAGLQMTMMALQAECSKSHESMDLIIEKFINELSGTHRYIIDYLMEEVLAFESIQTREFLMNTCILERFNADLCSGVCGDISPSSAQEILEYLERANLFIIPLDHQRQWFRYHHLFADMLHKQLLHSHPGLAPKLHHIAANWYEKQDLVDEALGHALQSADPGLLVSIIEKHALNTILQGRIATAQSWLAVLGSDVLLNSSRLCLDQAWALTFTGYTEAANPYLKQAEKLQTKTRLEATSVKSETLGLLSYCESMYGDADEAIRLATLAIENTPDHSEFLYCCNHLFLANALSHAGRIEEAQQEYQNIQPFCQIRDDHIALAMVEAGFLHYLAMFLNAKGSTELAKELLRQAIFDFESKSSGKCMAAAVYLYTALGKIQFIGNNLTEAEVVLEKGLRLDPTSLTVASFDGWESLWWVKTGQMDYHASSDILGHLQQISRGRDEKIVRRVILMGVLQNLLEEKIEQAANLIEKLGFTENTAEALAMVSDSELMNWRANEYFTYARVLAAQGKSKASLQILKHMEGAAATLGLDWIKYRTWIVQAIVHDQKGQTEIALKIITDLLKQTSKLESNPSRIYLAAGESARVLLQKALKVGIYPEHALRILNEFPVRPGSQTIPQSPETLTTREFEVLRLMADGFKNQEIAEKLVVSLNTVRYHAKNIFGKLDVSSRTTAVTRASQLGLLSLNSG